MILGDDGSVYVLESVGGPGTDRSYAASTSPAANWTR